MPNYLAKRKAENGTYSAFYLSSTAKAEEALAAGFQIYEEGDPDGETEDILLDYVPTIEPIVCRSEADPELLRALKIILGGGE